MIFSTCRSRGEFSLELAKLREPISDEEFYSMIRTMFMLGMEPYGLVNKFHFSLSQVQSWAAGNRAPTSIMRARIWDYLKELTAPTPAASS